MNSTQEQPKPPSERIRALNDVFRRTFSGGRIVLTPAVTGLPKERQAHLLAAVQTFSSFTSDNDPYGEHDFGAIDINADRFFWKIDYYNADCTAGSDEPSDPVVTTRVLTVMRSDEY